MVFLATSIAVSWQKKKKKKKFSLGALLELHFNNIEGKTGESDFLKKFGDVKT